MVRVIEAIGRFFDTEDASGLLENDAKYQEVRSLFEKLLTEQNQKMDELMKRFQIEPSE